MTASRIAITLAAMNWRRGILLAAIHLAVAVPLIISYERDVWTHLRDQPVKVESKSLTPTISNAEDNLQCFDPCEPWIGYNPNQKIPRKANFLAELVTGWGVDCRPSWTLASLLHNQCPTQTKQTERNTAIVFVFLIALQWIVVGGLSVFRRSWWWLEPCMVITYWTVLAGLLYLIPEFRDRAVSVMIPAGIAWFFWFAALLWLGARRSWLFFARRWRPAQ